jgi:hypothetical protein
VGAHQKSLLLEAETKGSPVQGPAQAVIKSLSEKPCISENSILFYTHSGLDLWLGIEFSAKNIFSPKSFFFFSSIWI